MDRLKVRWQLVAYDMIIFAAVSVLLLVLYKGNEVLSAQGIAEQMILCALCVFPIRIIGGVYRQIWRYGGIQCYIRLLFVDATAAIIYIFMGFILPIEQITAPRCLALCCMNLLGALSMRMIYRYAYKCAAIGDTRGKVFSLLIRIFAGNRVTLEIKNERPKVKIAIVGAGRLGVALASELLASQTTMYSLRCFIDIKKDKTNREIYGIPVLPENESIFKQLNELEIQEVVFALPNIADEDKKRLYSYYSGAGYKIKVYDYPTMQTPNGKRQLRDFDVEELLFRKSITIQDAKIVDYYRNKVVLITGGGGSIGSELCRQLAKLQPKRIVVLDIYENGAYDIQQELRIAYGKALDVQIEITSITNPRGMDKVFQLHKPDIVINAAAHKHVPLMEHNCIEAVENNVFGTQLLIDLCEKYQVQRFMMVSTDKAVNPTNVMGATKRMCEMLVICASTYGNVKYSITRFGNVLGSAGSVIPLFRKQIANGGPVTLTDKRIIRYFMTIPEASQLVLESGAMAKNGELFVLDMGQPVRILDLAESMIRLSGARDVEIVETGLRPGEKLFEELLVKTEDLDKTDNHLIFIERDAPYEKDVIVEKMALLKAACATGDDEKVKQTLMQVVPTYKTPDEVNSAAETQAELQNKRELNLV